MSGVAIKHWSVTSANLTRVIENNDLSIEGLGTLGRVVLGVTSDIATSDLLHRDVLDVEAHVVTRDTFGKLLVMHFDGLDFSGNVGRSEGNDLKEVEQCSR